MSTLENKLKTVGFWLKLGVINHLVALLIILFGCAYSGFTCTGDEMKEVLSVYAFTLFTPQLALEVVLLLALFLIANSLRDIRENIRMLSWFAGTLLALLLFMLCQ